MRSGVATNTVLVVAAAAVPASGPQMMLLALRAAGLRFGSFPRSKKQSKVGWHSRESNRDVSIRIHNTRYGRQTEGDVIFCTASFLPPPDSFRFRSTALARRKCCSPSRSLPPPPRRPPTFPIVCRRDGRRARSQAGANMRDRAVGILIGVCFGSTRVRRTRTDEVITDQREVIKTCCRQYRCTCRLQVSEPSAMRLVYSCRKRPECPNSEGSAVRCTQHSSDLKFPRSPFQLLRSRKTQFKAMT